MDSNVLLVPRWGQAVPRTQKIPYVEVQTICPDWNTEGTRKWQIIVGNLVPIAQNPDDQMEGAPKHPTKSTKIAHIQL